jgi:gamma-glutamyltranspeptidase / glutathione hydrolase
MTEPLTWSRARRHSEVVAVVVSILIASVVLPASRTPVHARHGMVAAADPLAARVGVDVLRAGGNAVDAAVAVGFALAVTYPYAGNIGGGGFMVIRLADGRETTIDFRERAPSRAARDMFVDDSGHVVPERSQVGALAAGVPGSVAGLAYARSHYGTRPLAQLVTPAVTLARDGFEVSWQLSGSLTHSKSLLSKFPASLRAFYTADGSAPQAGDRLTQSDLAVTLQRIADQGPDAFYRGAVADLIVAEMQRTGGLISKDDLASYRPVERPPVTGTYRGYRIVSMAPPSSGGVAIIELLNVLEGFPLSDYGAGSSRTMHVLAEAERRVFADRAQWIADPDFVRVPLAGLTSRAYAESLRRGIDPTHATPSSAVGAGTPTAYESNETTHYSVVDASGNAVAVTTTINGGYGNGQLVPGAGFLLNNEMDDFTARPGQPNSAGLVTGTTNAIAPGKRMLSSMAPTIVVKDGRNWLVTGSPGSGMIISTVLQTIVNMIDFGMNVQEAVDAPRMHHQWQPDVLQLERPGFPADVVHALEALGHTTRIVDEIGEAQAIAIDPATGVRLGAADPRGAGAAIGY